MTDHPNDSEAPDVLTIEDDDAAPKGTSTLTQLLKENEEAGSWYRNIHSLKAEKPEPDTTLPVLSGYLEERGFNDLEYIGRGTQAMVFASKDNPDIIFRICSGWSDRKVNPYLLQPIGSEIFELGNERYTIDTLKRVEIIDLNRSSPNYSDALLQDYFAFCDEAQEYGNYVGSMGRGREIGYYTYETADGTLKTCIMGADPSCLRAQDSTAHSPNHPSLGDQAQENLRLAKKDPRLAEFIGPLQAQLDEYNRQEETAATPVTKIAQATASTELVGAVPGVAEKATSTWAK